MWIVAQIGSAILNVTLCQCKTPSPLVPTNKLVSIFGLTYCSSSFVGVEYLVQLIPSPHLLVRRLVTGPRQQGEVFGAFFASGSDWLQWSSHPASRNHWRVNFLEFSHPHPHLACWWQWTMFARSLLPTTSKCGEGIREDLPCKS